MAKIQLATRSVIRSQTAVTASTDSGWKLCLHSTMHALSSVAIKQSSSVHMEETRKWKIEVRMHLLDWAVVGSHEQTTDFLSRHKLERCTVDQQASQNLGQG